MPVRITGTDQELRALRSEDRRKARELQNLQTALFHSEQELRKTRDKVKAYDQKQQQVIKRRPRVYPVRPSPALEMAYRKRLFILIEAMNKSVVWFIAQQYKKNPPALTQLIAQDASPTRGLRLAVRRLAKRWQKKIDETAPKLANYFAQSMNKRSNVALKNILKEGGFSVKFSQGPVTNDVLQSIVAENVSLIKSIPAQYFTQIEGMVMRSVQAGRDLETLTKDLQKQFGVTKRRATLIARDQNNKATASIQRAKHLESGITKGIWMHSGGGKEPRPTHVAAGKAKVQFDLAEGWFDPHERRFILPGELINCRCVFKPVIPGFE